MKLLLLLLVIFTITVPQIYSQQENEQQQQEQIQIPQFNNWEEAQKELKQDTDRLEELMKNIEDLQTYVKGHEKEVGMGGPKGLQEYINQVNKYSEQIKSIEDKWVKIQQTPEYIELYNSQHKNNEL